MCLIGAFMLNAYVFKSMNVSVATLKLTAGVCVQVQLIDARQAGS